MDTKRKEQLQRTLVFLGLGLLFTLSIWFIFRPSANEQSAAEQGLNKDVPQASPDELPTSKLKAYELGRDEEAEGRKSQLLGTLADYFNREGEAKAEPEPSEDVPAAIGRSIDKYEETARELESFYDLPAVEDDDVKRELNALRAELGALKEEKAQANGEVDQLELLEKSYQMAAKYLPSGNATPNPSANSSDKSVKPPASELPAAELSTERETVVSSLDQPISDSAFITEYGYKERNMGFRSVGKATPSIARNTLSVVVDRTTTIRQGDFLRLRLAESARNEGLFCFLRCAEPETRVFFCSLRCAGPKTRVFFASCVVQGPKRGSFLLPALRRAQNEGLFCFLRCAGPRKTACSRLLQ